jgi:hypothetical protein
MKLAHRNIYIDPSYPEFLDGGLFDLSNPVLNRDDQLRPFFRMRQALTEEGASVQTADALLGHNAKFQTDAEYYSVGMLRDYEAIEFSGVRKRAFVIMEPSLVAPNLYAALPELTRLFETVYIHNIDGDGYSLKDVDQSKLRRLYWPLPFNDVNLQFWANTNRLRKLVVINGKHLPVGAPNELYGTRIEAMLDLAGQNAVDLYGNGWDRWRDKRWLLRPSYWRIRHGIRRIYRGRCDSKHEVLSRYVFCLCFENMAMKGYISEKIFDCFYAGAVPIYLGAPDITDYLPAGSFVDARNFSSWSDLWRYLHALSATQIEQMRQAGRAYMSSARLSPFYSSIDDILSVP